MYDQHLRGFGLETTQFALLTAIETAPGKSQIVLARALGFEKATLSRNVRLMEQKGWVRSTSLTEDGRALLGRAKQGWSEAQAELWETMGAEDWDAMRRGLRAMTEAADRAVAG
jgi:DNA-binding MarR family transcriptional regulator